MIDFIIYNSDSTFAYEDIYFSNNGQLMLIGMFYKENWDVKISLYKLKRAQKIQYESEAKLPSILRRNMRSLNDAERTILMKYSRDIIAIILS